MAILVLWGRLSSALWATMAAQMLEVVVLALGSSLGLALAVASFMRENAFPRLALVLQGEQM